MHMSIRWQTSVPLSMRQSLMHTFPATKSGSKSRPIFIFVTRGAKIGDEDCLKVSECCLTFCLALHTVFVSSFVLCGTNLVSLVGLCAHDTSMYVLKD